MGSMLKQRLTQLIESVCQKQTLNNYHTYYRPSVREVVSSFPHIFLPAKVSDCHPSPRGKKAKDYADFYLQIECRDLVTCASCESLPPLSLSWLNQERDITNHNHRQTC